MTKDMNGTDAYINYLEELKHRELPQYIKQKAKDCLLDYLGVTYAGAHKTDALQKFIEYSGGKDGCTILGMEKKSSLFTAVFVNSFHAHVMELDDGHRFGMIHLGAAVIPAVLAVAEKERLLGNSILMGIVMGYEAAARVAIAMQPSHKERGFHTASTCGTIGAAVGCAVALGMNSVQMKSVISAASTSASGLLEIQEDDSEMKPYNLGRASMNGALAAMMGYTGLKGPIDILGGQQGLFQLLSDGADLHRMCSLEEYYEIERIYVKPYASCRHCHSAMEAVMKIKADTGRDSKDVDMIIIRTYRSAVKGHNHTDVMGSQSAKLSLPYSVAAAYILEYGDERAFDECSIQNEEILNLTKKVRIIEDDEFTRQSPQKRIADVHIHYFGGTVSKNRVDYAKGEPENPMTHKEIEEKFIGLMEKTGRKTQVGNIISAIERLEAELELLFEKLS